MSIENYTIYFHYTNELLIRTTIIIFGLIKNTIRYTQMEKSKEDYCCYSNVH